MKEQILEILTDIRPDIDFETEDGLVTKGILASFDIVTIVTELSDEFDISITPKDLVPANFDTLDGIVALVEKLSEE